MPPSSFDFPVAASRPGDPARVGPYDVLGRLGAGGMGTVYAGTDRSGAAAAVKVVHREFALDRDFRARFTREVRLVREVDGPCTPRFLSADTDAERPWLAVEYVPGPTLRRHVQTRGPLHGGALWGFAVGVAEALVSVHDRGIVHRDLKPGNVILGPTGPKVLDFGIARALDGTAITRTGRAMGTPGWVAPEVFTGAAPDPAADVFVWGALVACAATGRDPFGIGSAQDKAVRVVRGEADVDGVPEMLLPLLRAALAKDPRLRPSAGQALQEVLRLRTGPAVGGPATAVVPDFLHREWEAPAEADAQADAWRQRELRHRGKRRRRTGIRAAAAAGAVAALVAGAVVAVPLLPEAGGADAADGTGTAEGGGTTETAGGGDGSPLAPTGGREVAEVGVGNNEAGEFLVYTSEDGRMDVREGLTEYGVGVPVFPEEEGTGPLSAEDRIELREAVISFRTGEERDGGVVFTARAVLYADAGSYTVRSDDFLVLDLLPEEMRTLDNSVIPDPQAPEYSAFTERPLGSGGALAVLTPQEPEAEFTLTVPGAREAGYLVYRPRPEQVWGPAYTDIPVAWTYSCYILPEAAIGLQRPFHRDTTCREPSP